LAAFTVRVLALACALLAATSIAHADDDDDDGDDEDGSFVALPTYSIGILLAGHGTRIGGHSETGFGSSLELALGGGRWQYFVEGGIATSGMNARTTGAPQMYVGGRMMHAGVGARWLARQFRPNSRHGVELYLLSRAGFERFDLEDTRLTRPELALGFGLQVRMFKRPRLAIRLDARVLYTPSDPDDALVACSGNCAAEAGSSTGFATGLGFAW
jgi:hypothetical protein